MQQKSQEALQHHFQTQRRISSRRQASRRDAFRATAAAASSTLQNAANVKQGTHHACCAPGRDHTFVCGTPPVTPPPAPGALLLWHVNGRIVKTRCGAPPLFLFVSAKIYDYSLLERRSAAALQPDILRWSSLGRSCIVHHWMHNAVCVLHPFFVVQIEGRVGTGDSPLPHPYAILFP